MSSLLVFDFDGTIVDNDSVAKVLEILPDDVQIEGFRHYVELFQNAAPQVKCRQWPMSCTF